MEEQLIQKTYTLDNTSFKLWVIKIKLPDRYVSSQS